MTPFAPRALDRGLTALLVSLLRLQGFDLNPNRGAREIQRSNPLIEKVVQQIVKRAGKVAGTPGCEKEVEEMLEKRLDRWYKEAANTTHTLGYKAEKDGRILGLLKRPGLEPWNLFTCLNSLRNVEPLVSLVLEEGGMDGADENRDKEE